MSWLGAVKRSDESTEWTTAKPRTNSSEPRLSGGEDGTVDGTILESLPHLMYAIELHGGRRIVAHAGEKMRLRTVRLIPGDRVTVELSPFDVSRGRIVGRAGG